MSARCDCGSAACAAGRALGDGSAAICTGRIGSARVAVATGRGLTGFGAGVVSRGSAIGAAAIGADDDGIGAVVAAGSVTPVSTEGGGKFTIATARSSCLRGTTRSGAASLLATEFARFCGGVTRATVAAG